jgi:hypothetical protein
MTSELSIWKLSLKAPSVHIQYPYGNKIPGGKVKVSTGLQTYGNVTLSGMWKGRLPGDWLDHNPRKIWQLGTSSTKMCWLAIELCYQELKGSHTHHNSDVVHIQLLHILKPFKGCGHALFSK